MNKQFMMTMVLGCALVSGVAFGAQGGDVDAVLYEGMNKIQTAGSAKEIDALVVEYINRIPNNDAYADVLQQVAEQTKVNLAEPVGEEIAPAVMPEQGMIGRPGHGQYGQGQSLDLYTQAYNQIKAATTPEAVAAVYNQYLDQLSVVPALQDALYNAMNAKNSELQGGKKGGYKRHVSRCSREDAKAGKCQRRGHGRREEASECHASGTCKGNKWGHHKRDKDNKGDKGSKGNRGHHYGHSNWE